MKQLFSATLLVLACLSIDVSASAQTSAKKQDLFPQSAFNINLLGLLQFGPMVQYEHRVTDNGYIVPHVRLPYLGLVYQLVAGDDRGDRATVSPVALGLGCGYKVLLPADEGAWYFGGAADYSFGSSKGNDGKEWKSSFTHLAIMANGGYRWRFSRHKILSVGVYAGAYTALTDRWWYTDAPKIRYDERSTTGLAMLELSFGWDR